MRRKRFKEGQGKVDLSKGADWDCMLMNYSKYKRPMSYKVTANSFNDAVVFMSKVTQKEDHRRLIRVTALKIESECDSLFILNLATKSCLFYEILSASEEICG